MNLGLELIIKPFALAVGTGAVVAVLYLGLGWVRGRLTRR